jgi:NADH:ubiquinone reductase (non-electrogenic)
VGAETQTFGIKGVKEHACFMKELHDAERVSCFNKYIWMESNAKVQMQRQFMDCACSTLFIFFFFGCLLFVGLESAAFPGQSQEEIDRLLHMVVVGGGPTGIELR